MLKVFYTIIFILGLGFNFTLAQGGESISFYDVDIKVNRDASIDVMEKIVYDFGDTERHGIYRNIPYKYKTLAGNNTVAIEDFSVEDEQGEPYQYSASKSGGEMVFKIGDPNKTITREHIYVINYRAKYAVTFFENQDEIYWNAVGTGWDVPVKSATATVTLPEAVDSDNIKTACYQGAYGSTQTCQSIIEGGIVSQITYRADWLSANQAMTVVAGFPKGIVTEPTAAQKAWKTFKDNGIILLPFFVLLFMLNRWRRYGKDPAGRGTIVPQYDPPKGMMPILAGTLIDEYTHPKDFSAQIIDLAVRGYLTIDRLEGEGILKKTDYQLNRTKKTEEGLDKIDKKILESVFSGKQSVKISDLKNEYYTQYSKVTGLSCDAVAEKGYFAKNPSSVRLKWIIGGSVLLGILSIPAFFMGAIGIASVVVSEIIVIAFGFFMPKKTAKGVELKEYLLGLKHYITVAERERIKFHNAPAKNPKLFETLLPYAMVFGAEKEWAKQFEGLYKESPSWYHDPGMRGFHAAAFASSMTDFSASASSNMTTAGSGGSGFSGGAGGGGGGGGGGSW